MPHTGQVHNDNALSAAAAACAAAAWSQVAGVASVLHADHPAYEHFIAENMRYVPLCEI